VFQGASSLSLDAKGRLSVPTRHREVLAANAFMGNLQEVFANSVARPTSATGLKYPQVSQSFYNAAHEVMSGRATGEEAVRKLEKRLRQIRRKHW
jgi:trehalose/maltose transport system substrate-binding protein